MGIEADIRAANTGEVGMRFIDDNGAPAASFPVGAPGGIDGPTAELEILRGELSRILIEHTEDRTDYRFDTQLTDVVDRGGHVTAVLNDDTAIDADLVVVAEGLRSRSRCFVTSADVNDLGMYFAYVTIPREQTDDQWWNWQHVAGSRSVHTRPDNLGTTRAILTFMSDVRGLEDLASADQINIVRRTFDDVGGAAPRILAALNGDAPLYFSSVGQVSSPRWSRGRVALLGDAAFCPATFGGGGTSMALIGAYVLAGELSSTDDQLVALARYEQFMRPVVEATPLARTSVLRRANPRTRAGIRAFHASARLIASPVGSAIVNVARKRFDGGGDGVRLPDYEPITTEV